MAVIGNFNHVSANSGVQAQVPHVVVGFLKQLPYFGLRHIVRLHYGKVKQQFFVSCASGRPERAERRQQFFRVHISRKANGKRKPATR